MKNTTIKNSKLSLDKSNSKTYERAGPHSLRASTICIPPPTHVASSTKKFRVHSGQHTNGKIPMSWKTLLCERRSWL